LSAVTEERLFARVASAVDRGARVWVAPSLAALGDRLARSGRLAASRDDADVAVIHAGELDADGRVSALDELDAIVAPQVLALLFLVREPRGHIVSRCRAPVVATVSRAYTDLAVLEVGRDGLVVVELAPGVSATEVQRLAEPTLHLDPQVRPMPLEPSNGQGEVG
jgi:hypothetical protein